MRILTDDQIVALAAELDGTRKNVYQLSESLYGAPANELVFERLETVGGVFKCEECGTWLSVDERSTERDDACQICIDEDQDEEDEDD